MNTLKIAGFIALFLFVQSFNAQESFRYFKGNLTEATQQAKKDNKQVLAEFYTDSCSNCKNFKTKTLTDQAVIKDLNNNFIFVEFDAEKEETEFVARQKMDSFPVVLIINNEGKILKKKNGAIKPAEFLKFIGDQY